MKSIQNGAKGRVYYGLHCYPGVAYYSDDDAMILLTESVLRKMDSSFSGCPIYVDHKDAPESLDEARDTADGWVANSFYNTADGKHWVKFVVVTDRGEKAIKKGWQLSNCYTPKKYGAGGTWNGIEYDNEVLDAEFDHLAIVPNPRYAESIILTPEEFKNYNDGHFDSIKQLANSLKGKKRMAFSLFRKEKVEVNKKLKNTVVILERSGVEVTFEDLVKFADDQAMKHIKNSKKKNNKLVDDDEEEEISNREIIKLKRKLNNALSQLEEYRELLKNSEVDNDDEDIIRNAKSEDDEDMENSDDEEDDTENSDDEDEDEMDMKKKSSKNKNKKSKSNSESDEFLKSIKQNNKEKLDNAEDKYRKSRQNENSGDVIYDARARLKRGRELFG